MRQHDSDLQASPAGEVAWFFDRLFAGIQLDDNTRARAQEVIANCVEEMRVPRSPGPGIWDRWDEAMGMYTARDRELVSLLPAEAQDTFLHNSAALRAHFDAVRAQATDRQSS